MKIKHKIDKDKLFFTADTHFFDTNVINFCNRPYKDITDMNEQFILNWNDIVPEDGIVVIAGDFAFTGAVEKIKTLLSRLNGKKYLVFGNHCVQNKFQRPVVMQLFDWCGDILEFTIDDEVKFCISHYPFEFWTRGAIHLHGHVHSGPKSNASEKPVFKPMRYDIGVDNCNYRPISYEELKIIITKQIIGYE